MATEGRRVLRIGLAREIATVPDPTQDDDYESSWAPANVFGAPSGPYVPAQLSKALAPGENYVCHERFVNKGNAVVLVLTDARLYKLGERLAKRKWAKDLREIHSADVDCGRRLLVVRTFERGGPADEVCVQRREFFDDSSSSGSSGGGAAEIFCIALGNRLREHWQRTFEERLVPPPDAYQCHFVVVQHADAAKAGKRRKAVVVCVALTDRALLLVHLNKGGQPASVAEKVPFERIAGIALDVGYALTVRVASSSSSSSAAAANLTFVAHSREERDAMAYEVRRIFWTLKRERVPEENREQAALAASAAAASPRHLRAEKSTSVLTPTPPRHT